jgi:serine/threonine protein phosphatase PrpC
MTTAGYRSAAATDPGRVRGNNEDRVYRDDKRGLYFVIDGVGGEAAGERAAAIAEEELLARFDRPTGSVEDRIREGIALAGRHILAQAQSNAELAGMACVLTVAALEGGHAVIGHVGDTRLYRLRGGAIEKITRDHSPVGVREDSGEISEHEAMRHPRRNEIFRDVGTVEHAPDDGDFIEVHRLAVEPDSALLLCSDGLTDQVDSAAIAKVAAQFAGDPDRVARELVRLANEAGGKDNVSVVFVEGPEFGAKPPSPSGRKPWRSLAAGLAVGAVLGVLGTLGALRWRGVPQPEPEGPRTLVVAQTPDADYPTIQDAIEDAREGDTLLVLPGTYRESVRLRDGIHLIGRGGVVLEPKASVSDPGAAVVMGKSGSIQGFKIAGESVAVGVLAADSTASLDGIEIEKTSAAAVLARGASSVRIRTCSIHDNAGAGLRFEDRAQAEVTGSSIANNGRSEGTPHAGVEVAGDASPVLRGNVIAYNQRNVSWKDSPKDEAAVAKENLVIEAPRPRVRGTGR